MDAFWRQDVINEWNDEYSPRKAEKPRPKKNKNEFDMLHKKICQGKQSRQTGEAKKAFAQRKHDIAETFLQELDAVITDGKISELATVTGGIKIIWSKKLNTTAGRANWRRETIKTATIDTNDKSIAEITYRHYASIELAEKVIDDEDRLLNVIAHEFCHLASFMVSGVRNNPHGKEFKAWASKCSQQFGHRGIDVTTKHSYDIDYKYIWECSNCGTEFKRHSKSIDPQKHQCGVCKSKLVQTKPAPRSNVTTSSYQVFLKKNMKKVKEDNPGSPQKDIMGLMGKMYQEYKKSKLQEAEVNAAAVHKDKIMDLTEKATSEVTIDAVVRRLDFLDLTSP
jgi:predicted SprT family Zn-dependent metalloprotease